MVVDTVPLAVVLSVDLGRGFLPPGNTDDLGVVAVMSGAWMTLITVLKLPSLLQL